MMGSIRIKLIGSLLFGLMMFLTNFCGRGSAVSVHARNVSNESELASAISDEESEITLTSYIRWGRITNIGHTCTINLAGYGISGPDPLDVTNNGRLTINGTGSIHELDIRGGGSATLSTGISIQDLDLSDGTFTMDGGTIAGTLFTSPNTTCTLNSVTVRNIIMVGGTITITGGTISGNINLSGGTLIKNGGQITGDIELRGGTFIDNTSSGSSSSGSSDSSDKKSSHKKHTTASADYDYSEQNGQFVYGGLVDGVFAPTTMIPASAYPKFNSFLVKKMSAAEAGSTLSVNADPWTSINKAVADTFTEKGDIGLAIKYTQGGVPLQVTIPAGENLSEQLDENGSLVFLSLHSSTGQLL